MEAPSSDALMPERRRCPLKPWGPAGGNGFWGNPQEGGTQHFNVKGRQLIFFYEHAEHSERVLRCPAEGGLEEGVTSQSAERFIAPRVFSVSIGQNADLGALERGFYCSAGSRQARAEPRVTVEV